MVENTKLPKEVQLSQDLYRDYKTSDRANWGTQFVECRDFKMGAQWESTDADALEAANEPALAINEVAPSIDLVVSMLTENNPKFQVVAAEPSDTGVASDVADLHNYIWDISQGTMVMERAVNDFEDGGMGAFFVYTDSNADYGKGEIKVGDVDPLDLYIDPNSKKADASDANHILVVKNLTKDQIKRVYPNFDFTNAGGEEADAYPSSTRSTPEDQVQYPEIVSSDTTRYRAIDRYTKVLEKRYHVIDEISGFERVFKEDEMKEYMLEPVAVLVNKGIENYETKPRKVQELIQLQKDTGGTFHYMINEITGQPEMMNGVEHGGSSIPDSTTQIRITDKAELIESGIIRVDNPRIPRIKRVFTIGNVPMFNDILPLEDYPIIPFMLHHQRNPFPQGDIVRVKPLQEQLNKVNSKLTAYLSKMTSLNVFVPTGSGLKKDLESRAGKPGLNVFDYDPEMGGVPIVAQYPPLPAGVWEDKQQIINQIQRIIGAYAISDGNVQQAPQTKGGTILLDEYGQRRINWKRRKLEQALRQTAKVISQYIPSVYTEEKIIRITEPNHKTKVAEFNKPNPENAEQIINDLSIRYDVKEVAGSTLPTNKMQRYEILKDAFLAGVIRDNMPVIQYLEVPDVEALMEREDKLRQLEGMLQQADEEMKKLRGDLQTAERGEVEAKKGREVEKFKGELNRIGTDAKYAVEYGKKSINDEIKKEPKQESKNK